MAHREKEKKAQGHWGINYSWLRCEASDTTTRTTGKKGKRNVEPEPSHYTTVREPGYSLSASNDKQWASVRKFMNEVFVQSRRKLEISPFPASFIAGKLFLERKTRRDKAAHYARLKMALGVETSLRYRNSLDVGEVASCKVKAV